MRLLIPELSATTIAAIEARMRPGVCSQVGFLAEHDSLRDVVARDEEACRKFGITPEQIGDRLETIVGRAYRLADQADGVALRGVQAGLTVEERFHLQAKCWRGSQTCPFEDRCGVLCADGVVMGRDAAGTRALVPQAYDYAYADFTIENLQTKLSIDFPGLAIHLIRDHHFFEGSVRYRVDPERAIRALDLRPGKDYSPRYATEVRWRLCDFYTGHTRDFVTGVLREKVDAFIEEAEEVIDVCDRVQIYRTGDRCLVLAEREYLSVEPLVIADVLWDQPRLPLGTYVYCKTETKVVL